MLESLTMTLKHYMEINKVRIRDVATAAGVTEAYISSIRHGYRRPSPDVAKKIADAIGINVLDLLYPEDEDRQESAAEVSN